MIHNIEQKQIIRNYIKITLDEPLGSGTYILVLDKDSQGKTIDRWLETEDGCVIANDTLFKVTIEQFNLDTEKPK
jgi:hypothetical protein